MRHAAIAGVVACACALAAGCAGGAGASDDTMTCSVDIAFDPAMPVSGDQIRANSIVTNAIGVLTYDWHVTFNGTTIPTEIAQPDVSDITFLADAPGIYEVTLTIGGDNSCGQRMKSLNVLSSGNTTPGRLHITPPLDVTAPPLDRNITIQPADYDMHHVVLDPGTVVAGRVVAMPGNVGAPAYLRFLPQGMPDAEVQAFAASDGRFAVTVLDQGHDVIVVPVAPELAPRKITGFTPGSSGAMQIVLDGGDLITGSVRGPTGAAIAGAKVRLTIDGLPSSPGTTLADGSFTVHAVISGGATTTIEVTPPASLGLPRLEGTAIFDLHQPLAVTYASTLATRNLAGVHVRRGGSALANAKVTLVATPQGIGTVANGVLSATAGGIVRITASTDGTGALPATLAPALQLSAIVTVVPGDVALSAVDLSAGVPADITAPAMQAFSVFGEDPAHVAIPGVVLDLVPTGVLGDATAPALHFVGDASGRIAGLVVPGGRYDARWSDPSGKGGPRFENNVLGSALAGTHTLPPAVFVRGTIEITGLSNPVRGAAVQILCRTCTGIDRDRPLAEVASDALGNFSIAVPKPGAM